MNDADLQQIETACRRLVTAYCHYIDQGRASRVAELFTEDGVWASPEGTTTGLDAIRASFQAREDNQRRMSRHVCDNFMLTEVSADAARGSVYLTLYRHDGEPGRTTSPLYGPVLVGAYHDQFVLTESGWRIQRRDVQVDFVRPKHGG